MRSQRGHHKIFVGMAAGVGKTFRMLVEAQAEAEAGRDVVVGYLESHGRVETAAQADGLEVLPRRRVYYRDTPLEEMDLPGILARAAELCLIDEFAHTNAPGLEHQKRFEDVRDVLDAGIDVFSTVNVQHVESLNDQVAELTGTRVRETIPDQVLADADEVVLVDITPEALIARLRAGKVYPTERVTSALGNFFKIENLQALRETALRQVAAGVEARRFVPAAMPARRDERLVDPTEPHAIGERLLALITPTPEAQRVVRRAWRSAQRLGADLDLLIVSRPGRDAARERDQLEAMRRLAAVLGAHLLIEEGEDVAETAIRVARERGTTYLLLGVPRRPHGLARLREPLPTRLVHGLPGVDVRIVADRMLATRSDPLDGAPA